MKLLFSLFVPLVLLYTQTATAQTKVESYTQQIDGTTLSFEMQAVPAGEFTMGSKKGKKDELPLHKVKLAAFWIGKYEVTWDIYEPFLYRDYEKTHSVSPVPENVDAVTRPTK